MSNLITMLTLLFYSKFLLNHALVYGTLPSLSHNVAYLKDTLKYPE